MPTLSISLHVLKRYADGVDALPCGWSPLVYAVCALLRDVHASCAVCVLLHGAHEPYVLYALLHGEQRFDDGDEIPPQTSPFLTMAHRLSLVCSSICDVVSPEMPALTVWSCGKATATSQDCVIESPRKTIVARG